MTFLCTVVTLSYCDLIIQIISIAVALLFYNYYYLLLFFSPVMLLVDEEDGK